MSDFLPKELKYDWQVRESNELNKEHATSHHQDEDPTVANNNQSAAQSQSADGLHLVEQQKQRMQAKEEENLPSMVDIFVDALEAGRLENTEFSKKEMNDIKEYIAENPDELSKEQRQVIHEHNTAIPGQTTQDTGMPQDTQNSPTVQAGGDNKPTPADRRFPRPKPPGF